MLHDQEYDEYTSRCRGVYVPLGPRYVNLKSDVDVDVVLVFVLRSRGSDEYGGLSQSSPLSVNYSQYKDIIAPLSVIC
jgi:hypothetical protein